MRQVAPLFRMSLTMMLRSRGVVFLLVAAPLQMLVWTLLKDLDFGLGPQAINFFDFVVPGMSVFLAAHLLQDTVVAVAANYRARGVLKRLAVTPVSAPLLIAIQMATYVLLGVWTGTAMLAVGKLVGAQVRMSPNLVWVPLLIAIIVLTALGIAFAIAGFTATPQTASSLSGMLGLPLFLFTGAIFPVAALPGVLPDLVEYVVPFTAIIKAIRGIVLTGAPITDYGTQLLIGLAWLAVVFALAVRLYRFTDD
jgi:ABC-2 type transport system permease protein